MKKYVIKLTMCGIFAALSVALAFLAKSIFGSGPLRLTFENLPIFVIGFAYNPFWAVLCAVIADLLSCLLSGMAPLVLVTVGSALNAAVSSLVFMFFTSKMKKPWLRYGIPVFCGHTVGSVIVKSIALARWYGSIVFWRIPIYLAIIVIESAFLCILFGKKETSSLIKAAGGRVYAAEEKDEH